MEIIFILIGLFVLAGAGFNLDFFMENRRAQLFVSLLGRTGARIFYIILGLGFVIFGLIELVTLHGNFTE